MRCSTSRIADRYSVSFARSDAGSDALQVRDFFGHRIEHAALLAHAREPHFRIGRPGIAEQPLEDNARIVLRRQRRVGALPDDRAGVRARVAGIARAGVLARFHRQLERRQLRLLAGLVGENLIHRDADVEPGLARRRRHVGEEPRARLRMRAARTLARRQAVEAADDEDILAVRRERAERRRQLVVRADGGRQIVLHDHPVRHVEHAEAVDRLARRFLQRRQRRHHAVEQRQRQHRAHSAQHRAPRYRPFRNDHGSLLLNGVLVTTPRITDDHR